MAPVAVALADDVVVTAAVEEVVGTTTTDEVVGTTTTEEVVGTTTTDEVVGTAATEEVVGVTTADDVVGTTTTEELDVDGSIAEVATDTAPPAIEVTIERIGKPIPAAVDEVAEDVIVETFVIVVTPVDSPSMFTKVEVEMIVVTEPARDDDVATTLLVVGTTTATEEDEEEGTAEFDERLVVAELVGAARVLLADEELLVRRGRVLLVAEVLLVDGRTAEVATETTELSTERIGRPIPPSVDVVALCEGVSVVTLVMVVTPVDNPSMFTNVEVVMSVETTPPTVVELVEADVVEDCADEESEEETMVDDLEDVAEPPALVETAALVDVAEDSVGTTSEMEASDGSESVGSTTLMAMVDALELLLLLVCPEALTAVLDRDVEAALMVLDGIVAALARVVEDAAAPLDSVCEAEEVRFVAKLTEEIDAMDPSETDGTLKTDVESAGKDSVGTASEIVAVLEIDADEDEDEDEVVVAPLAIGLRAKSTLGLLVSEVKVCLK